MHHTWTGNSSAGVPPTTGFDPSVTGLDLTIAAGTIDGRPVAGATFTLTPPGAGETAYGIYVNASDALELVDETALLDALQPLPDFAAKPVWATVAVSDTSIDENRLHHYIVGA